MKNLPFGATGYCPTHNLYFGSITDTIPPTMCVLCGVAKELRAQPAPRTYEVSRALSWIDAIEAHPVAEPASLGAAELDALAKELIVTFVDAKNVGYYSEGVKTVLRRHLQHQPIKATEEGKWHYVAGDYEGPWFSEEYATEAECRKAAQDFVNANTDYNLDIVQIVGDEVAAAQEQGIVAAAPVDTGEKST